MEQHAVIRFMTLKKLFARDISAELEGMYGHEALSLSAVKKWRKRFVDGRTTLEDDPQSEKLPRSDDCKYSLVLIDETRLFHANACVRSCGS
jgi:hypothetical protein